jgi:hypothetical protein
MPEEPMPPPPAAHAALDWDLPDAGPEAGDAAAPAPVSSIADWAFIPADVAPEPEAAPLLPPLDVATPPEQPPADSPMSAALQRLEAREYDRQRVATAVAEPVPEVAEAAMPPPEAAERPSLGGFDDMVMGAGPAAAGRDEFLDTGAPDPAEGRPIADALFDADLFETDDNAAAAPLPSPAIPAASIPPQSHAPLADWTAEPAHDEPAYAEPVYQEPAYAERTHAEPAAVEAAQAEPAYAAPAGFMQDLTENTAPEHAQDFAPAPAALFTEPPAEPLPAMAALPDPLPEPEDMAARPPEEGPGIDTSAVLQRLESMRSAIASLMEEVSEKTARRRQPPPQ